MSTSRTKARYERPSIQRHRSGLMNKMGAAPAQQITSHVDGVPVHELIETYGSPVFVYSQRTIEDRVRALNHALKRVYPKVQVAWSYKTCYLDAICRIYHAEGSWAECVSGMEVDKALRNGCPMDQVIFNGPHKGEAHLEKALLGGAMVNLDHFDEIVLAERIAAKHDRVFPVGIRLNMAAGTSPRWDRFGFNLDNGQAWDAVRRITRGGHLTVTGLHTHLGTYLSDVSVYEEGAGKVAAFANRLHDELGLTMTYLDMGGGFASTAQLKGAYLPAPQTTPRFEDYAQAIAKGLATLALPDDALPLLLVETGRALIDEAGTLLTTALANKRLADGRRAVVLDAGVNVLFTSFWYKHTLTPCQPTRGMPEPTVLFGPLCMNIDVVCDTMQMPPLEVGQHVAVHPVGAYNVTQSMQFIHLRPAVALIGRDGRHAEIRRIETLEDLVIGESVPHWLEGPAGTPSLREIA